MLADGRFCEPPRGLPKVYRLVSSVSPVHIFNLKSDGSPQGLATMEGENSTKHTKNGVAAVVAGGVIFGTITLTLPFIALPTRKGFLPFMATPGNKVRKALEFIASNSKLKKSMGKREQRKQRFLDLGSGDGEAIYQAVQVRGADGKPQFRQAVGRELNPTLVLLSSLRRLTWTADQRSRSSFECSDFWKRPVDGFSTILIFGVKPLMLPLSLKLAAECKPGTYIMSYRFRIPLGDTVRDAAKTGIQAKMVYEEDEMRIYETIE